MIAPVSELVTKLIAVPPALDVNTPLPVNDDKPVPPCATARSVVNDKLAADAAPVTDNISSIVVVPPAESIVKLPDVVSISLSPVIPTWTLPANNPPNCASWNGVEAFSQPEKSSSLVNINLSVCISSPKKPSFTAEPL